MISFIVLFEKSFFNITLRNSLTAIFLIITVTVITHKNLVLTPIFKVTAPLYLGKM